MRRERLGNWKGSLGHCKDKSRYYETWHKMINLMYIKFPSKQSLIMKEKEKEIYE